MERSKKLKSDRDSTGKAERSKNPEIANGAAAETTLLLRNGTLLAFLLRGASSLIISDGTAESAYGDKVGGR